MRFRLFPYILLADIEKMYRQFQIRDEDGIYQKILWFAPNGIRTFVLNTLTFGFSIAPYLAIRCLLQLAHDERNNFPIAAKLLETSMYVDNLKASFGTQDEAKQACKGMIGILATAGMKMRQWVSNCPELLDGIESADIEANYSLDENSSVKTLGVF